MRMWITLQQPCHFYTELQLSPIGLSAASCVKGCAELDESLFLNIEPQAQSLQLMLVLPQVLYIVIL